MKKLIFTLLVLWSVSVFADDIIVLRTSEKINAKIIEVSDDEVKYKKANALDGPTFVTKTSQINTIIYESGDVQLYNQPVAVQQPATVYQPAPSYQQPATVYQPAPGYQQPATAYQPAPGYQQPAEHNKSWRFEPSEKHDFGFTFGYLTKNIKYDGDKYSFLLGQKDKMAHGFQAGFLANPTFKYGLGLRTGFLLEYVREKTDDEDILYYLYYSSYYIEEAEFHDIAFSIPMQLSFRMEVARNFSILAYTGPVFDFEVCAVNEVKTRYDGEDKETSNYKGETFNCLWGIGAGIQYKAMRLDVGSQFGMVDKHEQKWNKPVYVALSFLF